METKEVSTTRNGMSIASMLEGVEKMTVGEEIKSQYLSFNDEDGIPMGTEVKVVIAELTQINGMGEKKETMVDAVKIFAKDHKTGEAGEYVNADAVIVGFAKRNKLPYPVAITWKGWTKGGKGEYRDFQFNKLEGKFTK